MPTIANLPSGSWRAQVRRKGRYVSETFLRRDDALRWSRLAELSVDRNETQVSSRIGRLTKFGELVRLHIEDMTAVGKPPRRSKAEVPLVFWTPASFSFCCRTSKSTGDSIRLFVCLRFGL
jgi:hypothetical protein